MIYFCFWSRSHLFCWFCCFYWLQNESFSGWTIGSKNKAELSNAKSVRCGCADVLWKEGKCQKKTKTAVEAQNTAGIRGPPSEEDRKYCKVNSESETNSSLTWCRYTMMWQWSFVTSQWASFQKCVSRHTLEGKDNEEKMLTGLIPRNTAENKIFIGFFVLKKLKLNVACDSTGKASDFPSAMLLIGICLILFASIIKPTQRFFFQFYLESPNQELAYSKNEISQSVSMETPTLPSAKASLHLLPAPCSSDCPPFPNL